MDKSRYYKFQPVSLAAVLFFAPMSLLPASYAMAQDVPAPAKKPEQHTVEKPSIQSKILDVLNLRLSADEEKPSPENADVESTASENEASPAVVEGEAVDFAAVPLPPKKPHIVPKKRGTVERLVLKAQGAQYEKPISRSQAELYRSIFDAQRVADFKSADKLIEDLDDTRLLGHVLFQRYMHPTAYTSTFEELQQWMDVFGDHPGASRIYKLALAKRGQGSAAPLKEPSVSIGIVRTFEPSARPRKRYVSSRKRTNEQISALNTLNRRVFKMIRNSELQSAMGAINENAGLLDDVEYDLLRAEIASAYLYHGKADTAYSLAKASIKRSGLHVPKAGWVAGLVAWRNKDYMAASRYFEVTARSPYASGWTLTAGSYWAARSHMRTGNVKMVSTWLKRGVKQRRTFYGLVSTRALGRDFDFNWKIPAFTKKYLNILNAMPAGNRAIALVMAGQNDLAEAELIRIKPENNDERTALLAYSNYANLPGLALRLATSASDEDGGVYDAALYPTGSWKISEGSVDPALVHAIMRQESRFDPNAESPSGAKGLMQLMPATAKSVALTGEEQLHHAETNLELGRRYIENLLETDVVGGDLVYLLVAYNAGPGNLAKWKKRWPDVKDPLLFIELIPLSETRAYVERVLSNYWIYRMREGLDTPTLDAITSGKPALYGFKSSAKEL